MNIIIGGGTGLVGHALITKLLMSAHKITVVGRSKEKIKTRFQNSVQATTWDELNSLNPDEFDVIINLTGENIAEHRWSAKIKKKLLFSRIDATQHFVLWAKNARSKKPRLYNASAIGIYGLQKKVPNKTEAFTEQSTINNTLETSFSSQLVKQWEQAALQGMAMDIPITLMRFGVVLKRGEGILKKLELPTRYGMGAIVGTGEQPLAWIDHVDLVNGILFLISHPEITGPVNLVAPQLVSQKIFTKTLAKVLNKPAFLHLPEWFVKLTFGEMGEELLLSGQAVIPERLLEYQFRFEYPDLSSALAWEFSK